MPSLSLSVEPRSVWARRSVTLKLVAIAAMSLVLLVPLLLLRGLISERENLRDEARRSVAATSGGPQTVGGPVLTVPYEVATAGENNTRTVTTRYAHFLPDGLTVDGTVAPRVLHRGIYDVVVYGARLRVRATFPRPDAAGLDLDGGVPRYDRAFVQVGIPDLAGVNEAVFFTWDGQRVEAGSGIATADVFDAGVSAPVPLGDPATTDTSFAFETVLDFNGSSYLHVLPVGKTTDVSLRGAWPKPSFEGAFSPDARTVADSGFSARWRVLALNRNYPQRFVGAFADRRSAEGPDEYRVAADGRAVEGSAFGVALLLPVDAYQKTMRTAEYGLLFVLLTFATFFFVEVLGGRRVHPVQYLLVGFAVCLFYLMLLAFAEYLAFNLAYLLAAGAILALVLLYTKAIFASWRLAGTVAGLLAVFYGYFFVLLQLEAYALLAGSLGLFVILAALMYLSRRVDWYGLTGRDDAPPPAPPVPPPTPAPLPTPVAGTPMAPPSAPPAAP